jgi:hypothetical protein
VSETPPKLPSFQKAFIRSDVHKICKNSGSSSDSKTFSTNQLRIACFLGGVPARNEEKRMSSRWKRKIG